MKRHLGYRIVAGFWGVWFTAALVGPATLHACPEHAAQAHAAHAAVSHHDGHSAAVAEQDAPAPTRAADADCNCLGDCASAAIETPKQQVERTDPFVEQSRVATIRDAGEPNVVRDYDQPFANGPPSGFSAAA